MSAPIAESKSAPSGVALVAIAGGLMVLAAIAAFLLFGTGGPIDGRAQMQKVFGAADLPFGLQVESATSMSSSGTLVVYSVPGTAAESAAPGVTGDSSKSTEPPVDWSKITIPKVGGAPRQVAFLFVPADAGRSMLDDMIRRVQGRDRGELGRAGGTVLIERGRLDYRGWDSDWIHMRTYEPGGTFRDAMRISLSTPEDPCVMTATWSRGEPASLAVLKDVISPLVSAPR